ncbi:hypothetical protein Q8F55_007263 [Vanrija albida]|uniref:Uncharacterized protein n=1 Tax=Vanrija albida TaxID=181172 RepID=A0ABR3PZD3_9TREE
MSSAVERRVGADNADNDSGIVSMSPVPAPKPTAHSRAEIAALLDTMDAGTLRALLLEGWDHPSVAHRIEEYASAQREREDAAAKAKRDLEASPPIDFDEHAEDARFHLVDKFRRDPPRIQVNRAFDVARHLEHLLDDIVDRTKAHPNWGTKHSAARTILRIYDVVLVQGRDAHIPEQVRTAATWWGAKMGAVLGLFDPEELDRQSDDDGAGWFQKLRATARRGKALGTLDSLEDEVGGVFVRAAGSGDADGAGTLAARRWESARG